MKKRNYPKTPIPSEKRKAPRPPLPHAIILIGIGFVFLYPVLYMVVNSLKSVEALVDPAIEWLPRGICLDNFPLLESG